MTAFYSLFKRVLFPILVVFHIALPAFAGNSLTIVYSGNLDGELEPCGCSAEGNFGGLKRRASLLASLRKELPGLVVISSGGLLSSDGPGDRLKSEYILKGFAKLDYDAIGLQWRDLVYGAEFSLQSALPWVASNWAGEGIPAQRRIERGGNRLNVFSWLPPDDSPLRQMPGSHKLVTADSGSLREALRKAKAAGDLTVLTTTQTAEAMAELIDLADVDILIERSAYEVFGEPRQLGGTLVLTPGSRGMRLGRLDLTLDGGRIATSHHTVLPMPTTIADAPWMAAWYDEYNARVKADYLQRVELRKQREGGQSPFVGEEACAGCHAAQHAVWAESDHAVAYEDLEAVNKSFDPQCIVCHTVGFDRPGGFVDMNITGHLMGVQCESCHGAGREHVQAGGHKPTPNAGWPREKICAQCHTQPHSPGFVLEKYWPKIAH